MDLLSTKKLKARKEHKCFWCGLKIEPKTYYEKQSIADGGTIHTWKNHIKCREIAEYLDLFDFDEELSNVDFQDFIKEEFSSIIETQQIKDVEKIHLSFEEKLNFVINYYLK